MSNTIQGTYVKSNNKLTYQSLPLLNKHYIPVSPPVATQVKFSLNEIDKSRLFPATSPLTTGLTLQSPQAGLGADQVQGVLGRGLQEVLGVHPGPDQEVPHPGRDDP